MTKQELALTLFLKNTSIANIAQLLGVNERTVGRWKKEEKWEEARVKKTIDAQESAKRIWRLINYQTKALNVKIEDFEKAAQEGGNYETISSKDIDALQKLYAIVKKKDIDFTVTLEIVRELSAFMQAQNLKLTKKVMPLIAAFIDEQYQNS